MGEQVRNWSRASEAGRKHKYEQVFD